MSAAEIIEELPKLSADQRSAVLRRLRELEEQDALLFLEENAESMFLDLDEREKIDADSTSRRGLDR